MEYLVASLLLVSAVGYAVFIAVNVEKGKSWALEIARAISMLDAQSVGYHMREQAEEPVEPEVVAERPAPDRLAA